MNAWLLLAIAIASELIATTSLKASHGFRRPLPSIMVVLSYGASFYSLSRALQVLPLGIAYAVWGGVGVAVTALIGLVFFREALTPVRVAGLALIVAGVVAVQVPGR